MIPLAPDTILLRLLRATWDPAGLELPAGVPWPAVVDLADRHGVSPIVRAAVYDAGLALPPDLLARLDQSYFITARDNVLRFDELGHILDTFAAGGIPVVILKGAALAEAAYANLALRPMGDFDLLIAPEQLAACSAILRGRGYRATEVEVAPGAHLAYRNEAAFVRQEPFPSMVELHWHLVDVPYYLRHLPVDWFWERTVPIDVAGRPVLALAPVPNLLYLAAHLAFHHRFHGLRWLVDMACVVGQAGAELDWDALVAAAARFELLLVLRESLDRLAALWPSLPLATAIERLHALHPTPAEARIYRLLTAEPRSALLDFYADLVCLPDLPARARFLWLNLFPQRAYMARRYGPRAARALPIYYLYRVAAGIPPLARTLPQALRLHREG